MAATRGVAGGSSPFPYYRESVRGTVVTTNLETGGKYTNLLTAKSRDHTIVDNGDGTITVFASGTFPGDPSDDIEVPDSFRVVRGSTGNSDFSDRDFCADLVQFTS
jgi:hypothetical protein